jgi:hypothetical protein
MIERTEECLGFCPERLAADSAYGSAELLGWLVNEHAIEPHIPVFDKSARNDGTFAAFVRKPSTQCRWRSRKLIMFSAKAGRA